jgi:arabinogalactan oligomer/maltooligosaccharide transport system substrate-binding protein
MSKKLMPIISVLLIAAWLLSACGKAAGTTENVTINLWTKEGETDGGLQYVTSLTDAYTAAHPNVTFVVVNKEVETLREDFQTASLAGAAPELLWTVSDHLGPFTAAGLIQPVDKLVDLKKYVSSAVDAVKSPDGQTWGVPLANGNHLMLLFNKSLMPVAPKNTDELISMGKAFQAANAGKYALVFNQTEPFFFIPWLGGFNGKVFAADGVTPTLNTPEMTAALQFIYDLKFTEKIIPPESDYDGADTMFKEGTAAMIINGDWSLGGYKEALGDNLGVAPIPQVSATGTYPAPLTSGVFFMIPEGLEGAKLDAVVDFINFATNKENQLAMVSKLSRLPALTEALTDKLITDDPILSGSAAQMSYGLPMPTVIEMRCVWDSWKPEMQAVFADTESPADAAAKSQSAAESCIAALE